MATDDEMGGDPACWAHLFDDSESAASIDLVERAHVAPGRGPIWTQQTEDLNVNLLRFRRGEGVDEHVNNEVDVLLVGVDGTGDIVINGNGCTLAAGQLVIIPKGAVRSIRATAEFFSYLTCHRRRAGLMPSMGRRSSG